MSKKHFLLIFKILISSKVVKYKEQYRRKMSKYKRCDTIVFGNVLGYEKAILIQNTSLVIEQSLISCKENSD